MSSEFEEGDVVYCAIYGKGVVKAVGPRAIHVMFDDVSMFYLPNGSIQEDGPRLLFFTPPKITPGAVEKSKKKFFKPGSKVIAINRSDKAMYTFISGMEYKDSILDDGNLGLFPFELYDFYVIEGDPFGSKYINIQQKRTPQ